MTFKLGEIRNMKDPLIVLLDKPLPIKVAWNLNKLVKVFDKELADIEEFRVDLIKKLGIENEDGSVKVPDDKMNDFVDEFNELLNQEMEISFEPISVDVLGDTTISAKDMMILERIFI